MHVSPVVSQGQAIVQVINSAQAPLKVPLV
jgi:hypothetical protein